jgi:hypothetical protein
MLFIDVTTGQTCNSLGPVMLLGQAESGKSTLQKQFQLYYAHQTLEHSRPLWRPVVYFNIIKAVRMILDELEYELANIGSDDSTEGQAVAHALAPLGDISHEITQLRSKLVALISLEDSLASELSGGVSVTGGRTGVFVRAGWQALVTPLSPNRSRAVPATGVPPPAVAHVTNLASRTLNAFQDEVDELWKHPAVRILLNNRRVRLDESAPLWVIALDIPAITELCHSFFDNMKRISQPDYLPTTGKVCSSTRTVYMLIEFPQPTCSMFAYKRWVLLSTLSMSSSVVLDTTGSCTMLAVQ